MTTATRRARRPHSLTVLLATSHIMAGAAGLLAAERLPATAPARLGGLILAGLVGLALTWRLRRAIQLLEIALTQQLAGLAGELIAADWPCARLIVAANQLGRQADERRGSLHELSAFREQLLLQTSLAAAQTERNRLARDLHDSIKQQIFSIGASIAAAQARWESDRRGSWTALGDARRSVHEANVEMRALLQQLRPAPLETVGLIEALRDQAEALGYRSGASVVVDIGQMPADVQLAPGMQEAVFRIAQEALANIARHARARHVRLALHQCRELLQLSISDDGRGFAATAQAGMGIANMRERAALVQGSLEIESHPGSGTSLRLRLPLAPPSTLGKDQTMRTNDRSLNNLTRRISLGIWLAAAGVLLGLAQISLNGSPPRPIWLLLPGLLAGVFLLRTRRDLRQLRTEPAGQPVALARLGQTRGLALVVVCAGAMALVPNLALARSQSLALLIAGIGGTATLAAIAGYYRLSEQLYARLDPHELLRQLVGDRWRTLGISSRQPCWCWWWSACCGWFSKQIRPPSPARSGLSCCWRDWCSVWAG